MTKSAEIKNLAAALAKFQEEMRAVKKNATNPFFKSKYADLASIVDAIREPLSRNGLAYSQLPAGDGGLATILMHTSGEWIEETFTMRPVDQKPQSVGSAITYARRYALASLLGIATEEDDDGKQASKGKPKADDAQFANLMKVLEKSDAKALEEFMGKMRKSDKYTPEQKDQFAEAATARLADLRKG